MEENVYTIGKGKFLFRQSGQMNFRDLGNCPDFKLAEKLEKKPHYSSREGTKQKDKDPTIAQEATSSITLDSLLDENIKLWIMSNAITDVVQAQGTISAQAVTAELDMWIDLGKKKLSSIAVKAETPSAWQATHAYLAGVFAVPTESNGYRYECTTAGTSDDTEPASWPTTSGETVTDGTVVWTCRKLTYTLNTDYRLDIEVGHLMPLSTGDIEDGQTLNLDFSHAAITLKRMDAAKTATIEGDIYFVGNPPFGKIIDVKGYVSLTPKGDLSLIGEDYMNMQFDMEFLSGHGYNGLFEVYNRGIVQ